MSNMTITIDSVKIEQFRKLVDKFNKKAIKANADGVEIVSVSPINKKIDGNRYELFEVEINKPRFAMGSFQVDAIFTNEEGVELVDTFGGYDHPHGEVIDYRRCDHCNVKHARKTVVKISEDDRQLQVGKSCIADYMGVSLSTFNWLKTTIETITDIDEWEGGTSGIVVFDVIEVLAHTHNVCASGGYKNVESEFPSYVEVQYGIDKATTVGEESFEWAREAVDMVTHMIPTSNYEQNIFNIVKTGHVSSKRLPLLTSAYVMVERAKRKENPTEDSGNVSQYVGDIKERITFEGTVKLAYGIDGYYGYSMMYIIEDGSGNQFKWVATSDKHHAYSEGVTYSFTGTVSVHKVYNDVKQTTLKRCKVCEV